MNHFRINPTARQPVKNEWQSMHTRKCLACFSSASLLLEKSRDDPAEDQNEDRVHHVFLCNRKQHLCVGRHELASHEGNPHDQGTHSSGPCVVDRLEVLGKGELPVLRLQREAAPLVSRRGDDARRGDGEAKHKRLGNGILRLEHGHHPESDKAARPSVHNVASHRWDVGLVEQRRLNLPPHALPEAVVGDRQHHGAEQPAIDDATHRSGQGGEREHDVDDLKGRKLQHVCGEGRQEEVRDKLEGDIIVCLTKSHALHEQAVHQGLREFE
eukprot:UN1386